MYSNGRGVVKDELKAVTWLEAGAAQGDALAQFSLGSTALDAIDSPVFGSADVACGSLRPVISDCRIDVRYRPRRGQRRVESCEVVASCFRTERGSSAVQFGYNSFGFGSIPNNDHFDCTSIAGLMYYRGRGVAIDESNAVKLWEAAAAQGVAQAQFSLGKH